MSAETAIWIIAAGVPAIIALASLNTYQVWRSERAYRAQIIPPITALAAPAELAGNKPTRRARRSAVAKAMPRANGKFAQRAPS